MKLYIVQHIEGGCAYEPRVYATEDAAMEDFMHEATEWGFIPEPNTTDHESWRDQFHDFVTDLETDNDLKYYEEDLRDAPNRFIEAVLEAKLEDGDKNIITLDKGNEDQAEFFGVYVRMQVGEDFFPFMHIIDFEPHLLSTAEELTDRLNYLLKDYNKK